MSPLEQPLVSIVTPTFNSERFVEETILSVQRQTYANIEHIIVDGASTDGTLAIIARYPHVRLVSEPDEGMYDAYNKGLKMASGAIIGCLNSDDQYLDDTIASIVDLFAQHPGSDVVFGGAQYVDAQGRQLYYYKPLPFNWKRFASMDSSSLVFPSVFWRRSIHDRIGFYDTRYRMAADFDFYLRFKSVRLTATRRILSLFRVHPDALTYSRPEQGRKEVEQILARLELGDGLPLKLRRAVAKVCFLLFCYGPPFVMVRRGFNKLVKR